MLATLSMENKKTGIQPHKLGRNHQMEPRNETGNREWYLECNAVCKFGTVMSKNVKIKGELILEDIYCFQ